MGVQLKEFLDSFLHMVCKDISLRSCEDEDGYFREQNRRSKDCLHLEGGNRVGTVAAGETHAEDAGSCKGFFMADHSLVYVWKVSSERAKYTNITTFSAGVLPIVIGERSLAYSHWRRKGGVLFFLLKALESCPMLM